MSATWTSRNCARNPRNGSDQITRAVPRQPAEDVMDAVGVHCPPASGLWICPWSRKSEARAPNIVTECGRSGFRELQNTTAVFGDRVGVVTDQMKGNEKDRVMAPAASQAMRSGYGRDTWS